MWRLEFVESFEFVDDGKRRYEELAVGFGEQMRVVEAVELAHAAELDVGRRRVLQGHLRVAPLGDDDAVHRLALHLVDGDGAGWHERKLRELDGETLAVVELGREGLLDRQHRKHVRRQIGERAERRASAAQLDEHNGSHIVMTGAMPSMSCTRCCCRVSAAACLMATIVPCAVGSAERRGEVLGDHDALAFVEI